MTGTDTGGYRRLARRLTTGTVAAAVMATAAAAVVASAAGPALGRQGAGDQDAPAEGAQTWSVQPAAEDGADGRASFDYHGPAGASIDDFVQVNNFSEQPLTLRVYAQDAVNTGEGGFTLLPGDQPPADVGAWVGLDRRVTVPAEDHVVVPFTLSVPTNATPGDHPGGIVASAATGATDAQGNPVLVDHRVGARIYLRVDGELAPALEVSALAAGYSRSWVPFTAGEATVTYTVTNTGNVRLQGEQRLRVGGPLGVGERTLTLERLPEILPGESITATVVVDSVAPALLLMGELQVTPVPPLAGDPAPDPAARQASAWALPGPELLLLVLVGLLVAGAIWRHRRARRRAAAVLAEAVAQARTEGREQARREAHRPPPATTEPAEAEPAGTGPAEAEPAAAEPAGTGPAETGPDGSVPEDTGPEDTGPEDTGPNHTGPARERADPRTPAAPAAGGDPARS